VFAMVLSIFVIHESSGKNVISANKVLRLLAMVLRVFAVEFTAPAMVLCLPLNSQHHRQ
jgi:hypothetical protein